MSITSEVRQASDRHYAALRRLINGDPNPYLAILTGGSEVSMLHPLGGQVVGDEAVRRNLQEVAAAVTNGEVAYEDVVVVPISDDVAYTIGTERAKGTIGDVTAQFAARATNIYRKERGEWKIVHHHTDLVPEAAAALQQLLARAR